MVVIMCNIHAYASTAGSSTGAPLSESQVEELENKLKFDYAILAQHSITANAAVCEQALAENTVDRLAQTAFFAYSSQVGQLAKQSNEDKFKQEYEASIVQALVQGIKKDVCDLSEAEKIILKRHGLLPKKPQPPPPSPFTKKDLLLAGATGIIVGLGTIYIVSRFWPAAKPAHPEPG